VQGKCNRSPKDSRLQ